MTSCPHVHMFTRSHVHIFTYSHLHMSTCPHDHMFTCSHVHMSTCSYVHMFICSHVHMSIFANVHLSRTPTPVLPASTAGPHKGLIYTNNQILLKVYLDKGRVSDAPDSSETLDYETFVMINWSGPSQKRPNEFTNFANKNRPKPIWKQARLSSRVPGVCSGPPPAEHHQTEPIPQDPRQPCDQGGNPTHPELPHLQQQRDGLPKWFRIRETTQYCDTRG